MIYRKQDDFDKFHCIAGKCPESCCEAWQIYIDEESLSAYKKEESAFGGRLKLSIDWQEGCFLQSGRRCAMLNAENLCDLQIALGEGSLCDTCRLFPRHMEEFEDVREYSLDLSCPVAARMAVHRTTPMSFTETEDDLFDDEEDYEDFDDLFYDLLDTARDVLLRIAGEEKYSLTDRLEMILETARRLQSCYDEDRFFDMDDVIDDVSRQLDEGRCELNRRETFKEAEEKFGILFQLETLHSNWPSLLDRTKKKVLSNEFTWTAAMHPDQEIERAAENILISLIFTYFSSAVYDGEIYGRAAFSAYSVRWVIMITAVLREEEPEKDRMELMAEALWKYAREVEHSELNLNAIFQISPE